MATNTIAVEVSVLDFEKFRALVERLAKNMEQNHACPVCRPGQSYSGGEIDHDTDCPLLALMQKRAPDSDG